MNVSPFRNVAPHQYRGLYRELDVQKAPSSHGIAVSQNSVAIVEGSASAVSVFANDFGGDKKKLTGHGGAVTDLEFNPFAQDLLTTASADGTVKTWDVTSASIVNTVEFNEPVHVVRYHPSASNVLAVGSKQGLAVVDTNKGAISFQSHAAKKNTETTGLTWNYDGSLLTCLDKTKNIFVLDPRTNPDIDSLRIKCKVRPHQLLSLGSDGYIMATGNDMYRKTTIRIYDPRNPEEPLLSHSPPFSSGFCLPHFDEDSKLFYFTVRGSVQMNIYDMNGGYSELNQVNKYISETAFVGYAKVPKYVLDVEKAEVSRFMKASENAIQAVGMLIPRKVEQFDDTLFPLSASNEPAMSSDEYAAGENKEPEKKTLHPKLDKFGVERVLLDQKKDFQIQAEKTSKPKHYEASPFKKEEEKKEFVHVVSAKRKKMDAGFQQSTFLHTAGKEPRSLHLYYHHLQVKKESLPMANNIQCNKDFFAFAWNTLGGSGLAVRSLKEFGRCDDKIPLVRGHDTQVTAYSLSTLDNVLATGSDDAKVNVWKIPDGGLTEDLVDPFYLFQENGKITSLRFHDQVNDVLACGSKGFTDYPFKIFDINAGEEITELGCHEKDVWDIAWGFNPALVATTSRDTKTRVIDPRANNVVQEFVPPECVRDTRVLWIGNTNRLLTSGFAKRSARSFSLWDLRDTSKPLKTKELEISSGHLLPHYDEDTGLLFITAVGERRHRAYTVSENDFSELAGWQSGHLNVGFVSQGKLACDVKTVEVARFLKVTQDAVIPVNVTIPRKRKEFFQDDIFVPTRSMESLMEASEWAGGKDAEPKFVSLKPAGMENLSDAPPEEMTDRQKRNLEYMQQQEKNKGKTGALTGEQAIDEWTKVASTSGNSNRWDAVVEDDNAVDDDEWGDSD